MNIESAAEQLQALFEATNKPVKGNWIAPELADIVKILQNNLSGGLGHEPIPVQVFSKPYSPDSRSRKLYSECGICGNRVESEDHDNGHVSQWKHIVTAQPKPEAWQEIAKESAEDFPGMNKEFRQHLVRVVLAAIERSHAAQPHLDTPEEIQALHNAAARLAGAQPQRRLGFGTSHFDRRERSAPQPQPSKASPLGERSEKGTDAGL